MSLRTVLITVIAALSVGGCADDKAESDPAPATQVSSPTDTPTTSQPTHLGPVIPDGDYQRLLTEADVTRLGLGRIPAEWAPDNTLTNRLRFDGANMAQLANYDGGPMVVGSTGTITYDAEGRLLLDEPCCAPEGYTWKVTDRTLTLTPDMAWMKKNFPGFDPESHDDKMWMLMTGGTYTRVE